MGERGVEFEWEEKEGGRFWRERRGECKLERERERRYYSGGVRRECGWLKKGECEWGKKKNTC